MTIVFTDLVGSTELSQQLGDSAADDMRRSHFDALREAVAASDGTEVKTIGDALMVSYTSAADAIAGAVAMQQNVEEQNRQGDGPELAMRVGVSAGEATFEDGDWFGVPIVEASRLCSAADGGQILLADIVRVLAGSRSDHEMRPVGEIQAKGLSDPLLACEVPWRPRDTSDAAGELVAALPHVVSQSDAFSFVARRSEYDTLVESWKEAMAGDRRAVLVAGEPGIGKTRLVREICRLVHEQGAVVLWGGCEDELGIPFQPFAEALRGFANGVAPPALAEVTGPLGGELVRLVPDLELLVPDLPERVVGDPESERHRLFEAVSDLLHAISSRAAVVLVLDDLHWAGKPSLLLLRHLLRSAERLPLLVVVTYRDTDLDRTHPLAEMLADLRREHGVTRIALSGLDQQGVVDFMAHMAGHDLDDPGLALASALHAETEGNPFFVGEVLRHLAESGALVFRDNRWTSDLTLEDVGIPEGVREVVGRRLSHLDQRTNDVLAVAAVIGRDFELGLLGSLVEGGQDVALDAIEAAESSGLVAEGTRGAGSYRFAHALVRSTLYDELPTSRRLRLHRDVARGLAERADADQRLAELARHFAEAAALGEVQNAVEWGRRAGDAAMTELAWEEAATHYERALDTLELDDDPDPIVRCDLLRDAGASLIANLDPRAHDLLDRSIALAREANDATRFTDAVLLRCYRGSGLRAGVFETDPEMLELIEDALGSIGDDDGHRALLLSAKAAELMSVSDAAGRRELSDAALTLARGTGDRSVLGRVLSQRGFVFDSVDIEAVDDYVATFTEAIELATQLDDRELLCRSHHARAPGLIMQGQRAAGEADLRAAESLIPQVRQPVLELRSLVLRTASLLLSGRLTEAEAMIESHSEFAEQHGMDRGARIVHAFRLHYERGTLGELVPALEDFAAAAPNLHSLRAALVTAYSQADRPDDAVRHLRDLAANDWEMVPRDSFWIVTIAGAARLAGAIGELDIAARAYELGKAHTDWLAYTGASYEQPVALSVGVAASALGRFAEAEALFTRAAELSQAAEAPTFVAATQTQWADMCLARNEPGDGPRAEALATEALETAQSLGLARVEVLSRRVLDRL